jgi:aryl-alcohol dehydrogenase-like predicted oxidoreductase
MKQSHLGKNGLTVSPLGLGCMSMSEFYGHADEKESIATLHRAIERGINFFDTADVYGQGRNEEFVGKMLQEHRDKVIIATKFGIVRNANGEFTGVCSKPEYIRASCDASLRRLGIDTIDLYYQHRVDPETPIEDTIGTMAELVQEGKVRHLGLSEAGPQTIRKAHAVHPIAALQTEYSLWSRDPEEEILPTCRELGIGFVPYSPLGRGFLTHNIKNLAELDENDWRRNGPRFQKENFQRNLKLVEAIEDIANEKHCTPAQLALAWVLAQGNDIVPIPGTTKTKHLEDNLAALNIQLSQDEIKRINQVAPIGIAAGSRYPEWGMNMVNL